MQTIVFLLALSAAHVAAESAQQQPVLVASPMYKVKQLLSNLRIKVLHEGDQEATSYEKFACFCKKLGDTKNHEILQEKILKANLAASVRKDSSDRAEEDEFITEKTQSIRTLSGEIQAMTKAFKETTAEYDANSLDLTGAMANLESSIQLLSATQTQNGAGAEFAQVQPVAKTIHQALDMAEKVSESFKDGKTSDKVFTALISLGQEPSSRLDADMADLDYGFKSTDVIGTLQSLQEDFRKKKAEIDGTYLSEKQEYETLLADKHALLKSEQEALDEHRAIKARLTAQIQQAEFDYSATNAELIEDVKFLEELRWKCHEKAVLWDQRVALRGEEITAVQSAIDTVNQVDPDTQTAADIARETAAAPAPALLQIQQEAKPVQKIVPVKAASSQKVIAKLDLSRRKHLMSLLKSKGTTLKSATLLHAAERAGEDPWGKVKDLLQELVEGFLKQTQEEATHKGWCDKEYAVAYQNRDYKVEQIKDVNVKLQQSEARRADLATLISGLQFDMEQANATLAKAQEEREIETQQNAEGVREAEEAREGINMAIDIMKKFYESADRAKKDQLEFAKRNNTVTPENLYTTPENTSYVNRPTAFLQLAQTPATNSSNNSKLSYDEATNFPDAGFDDVYNGQQGQASGVVSMLEVLSQDFTDTIKEINKEETASDNQLQDLEKDTQVLLTAKETAQQARMASKREADQEDEDNRVKLTDYQASLEKTLSELSEIDQACNTGGMTLEERKAKREEEIEALNKGLCILNAQESGDISNC